MSEARDLRRALAAPPLPADFAATVLRRAATHRRRRWDVWSAPLAAATLLGAAWLGWGLADRPAATTAPPSHAAGPATASRAAEHPLPTPAEPRERPVDPAWSVARLVLGRAERVAARPLAPAPVIAPTPEPPTVAALRRALFGRDPVRREQAAQALAARTAPAARTALLEALAVPETAPDAARALARADATTAAPALRQALVAWLDAPGAAQVVALLPSGARWSARDDAAPRALLAALASLQDRGAVDVCLRALEHPALQCDAHAALVCITGLDRGPEAWRWRCWLAGRGNRS